MSRQVDQAGKKMPEVQKSLSFRGVAAPLAGVLAIAALGGCGRSQPAEAPREIVAGNAAAPADETGSTPEAAETRGILNTQAGPAGKDPAPAAAKEEEKKGPARTARCRINDEPERPCTFTPVLGDGSFDIEMPDRQLRLIVSGNEAAPFDLIGTKRIPLVSLLERDAKDPACWETDDPDAVLKRVCAR